MLTKKITYKDFNDVEITEQFYFNLTKSELTEMEMGTEGGYAAMLQQIIDSKDVPSIISVFKKLILKSYGVKSADGKRFMKSEELSKEFSETLAYDQLFMELSTDAEKAAAFVNGIIPQELKDKANEAHLQNAVK